MELAVRYGPALAVLFVGGYVALGARHWIGRVLAFGFTLALAAAVLADPLVFFGLIVIALALLWFVRLVIRIEWWAGWP